MNEVFTQDRMARNSVDFDGSGVGNGYYSAKEEQRLKWENLKLPIVLAGFCILFWVALISITLPEIDMVQNGIKVTAHRNNQENVALWKAPDGRTYNVDVSWSGTKSEYIDVYYKDNNYNRAIAPMHWKYWIGFYGFGVVITAGIAFWMKKILFKKKHAVPREEKSYKDY